jgi:hypothetical protein
MTMTWNPNVVVAQMSAQPVVQMGQELATMERRKRGCRYGARKNGRCPSRRR